MSASRYRLLRTGELIQSFDLYNYKGKWINVNSSRVNTICNISDSIYRPIGQSFNKTDGNSNVSVKIVESINKEYINKQIITI